MYLSSKSERSSFAGHPSSKDSRSWSLNLIPARLQAAGNDPNEFGWVLRERFARIDVIGSNHVAPFSEQPTRLANLRCSGWRG
jgi:hypothetical protein